MHPQVEHLLNMTQYEQRSPEWYEVRKGLLTASDVAAALNIPAFNSFKGSSRLELLKKKKYPERFPFFTNAAMEHGVKYESESIQKYEEVSGEKVLEFGLIVHPDIPWLGASADGITESGILLEAKCPTGRQIVPGEIPHHYLPQVQTCMEVLNLERAVFIQYKPECITWPKPMQLDITYVDRDREWWKETLPKLEQFRKDLETFTWTPPEPKKPKKILDLPFQTTLAGPSSRCLVDDDLYD